MRASSRRCSVRCYRFFTVETPADSRSLSTTQSTPSRSSTPSSAHVPTLSPPPVRFGCHPVPHAQTRSCEYSLPSPDHFSSSQTRNASTASSRRTSARSISASQASRPTRRACPSLSPRFLPGFDIRRRRLLRKRADTLSQTQLRRYAQRLRLWLCAPRRRRNVLGGEQHLLHLQRRAQCFFSSVPAAWLTSLACRHPESGLSDRNFDGSRRDGLWQRSELRAVLRVSRMDFSARHYQLLSAWPA